MSEHPNVIAFPTKKMAAVPRGVDAVAFQRLVAGLRDCLGTNPQDNEPARALTEAEAMDTARRFVEAMEKRGWQLPRGAP